jgi:putative addiction module component (TIGR02574 family)
MATATVRQVIALASELSEEERGVVVDAIAPKESVAKLAREWEVEIERRAASVRAGDSARSTADEVFARVEAKLPKR